MCIVFLIGDGYSILSMAEWSLKWVENILGKAHVVDSIASGGDTKLAFSFKPIITVSRDPGSGGHPIAKAVAKQLRFEFFDEELIHEIARSAKARDEIIRDIDEKQRTLIDDFVHNSLNPEYVSERRYLKHLVKVVLAMAQRGRTVIVGRGSNFIVPSDKCFRVRITAPYRICVARAVKYENVPYQRAREIINKVSSEREVFVKQYFGKDITNPKHYDMTLNTAYMTIESAAAIIVQAFKRKFP